LRVFAQPDARGPSAWSADLGEARLVLTLSPHRTRGFSGEGGVLTALADPVAATDAVLVQSAFDNRRRISERQLAITGLSPSRLHAALTWIGAHGSIGYDPVTQEWFQRDLPFTVAELLNVPPRLRSARTLVDAGMVTLGTEQGATIHGSSGPYQVQLDPQRCQCEWWRKHPGDRGPCRHLLAALIARAEAGLQSAAPR
jgi:hypothetical protein